MAALGAGCGGSGNTGNNIGSPEDRDSGTTHGGDATAIFTADGPSGFVTPEAGPAGPDVNGPLSISPRDQTIDINYGQAPSGMQFSASINGYPVGASFAIDRGEIGSLVASTGMLTPSGTVGGTANVSATFGSQRVTTTLTVRVHFLQNGDPSATGDGGAGDAATNEGGSAGGNGGVGGEGVGGPVDPTTQGLLLAGPDGGAIAASDGGADGGAAGALAWLYPYDGTVWPRGLLAPLLQWNAPKSYDAVYIHLSENDFDYQGFFSATATPFVHHPVPQAAWDLLCSSNQGEKVSVTLVFSSGGEVEGPLTETWTIAHGSLTGTVYYNSYGTNLAHNYPTQGPLGPINFGGATLAIKHGATSPVLVAGNDKECRVCHSVSADGSRLVTANGGNYPTSAWYDLKNGNLETGMAPTDGRFNWGGLSPDGTFLLGNGGPLPGGAVGKAGQLFTVATGATYASSGMPNGLVVGSPVFSPDGTHVAFNFYSGSVPTTADAGAGSDAGGSADGGAPLKGDGVSLAAMDYDATSSVFSNFRVLFKPQRGTAVWPTYLPTNDAVVFELETQNNGRDWGGTRSPCDSTSCASQSTKGTQAELWWVDLATKVASRLDQLNGRIAGTSYLPTMPATDHTQDEILNYEPTVSPVPSGGYAWVVFTSRRLYGNIATIKPYWSDPRYVDLRSTPTTKKLWVAAVNLNGTPGTDTSHPAFYLPAQEILAGNSRGYWVVDPCEQNGSSCQTGDQCCGGYCENMMCSAQPPACSTLNDRCATDGDCCGVLQGTQCINGRCADPTPTAPPPPNPIIPR